MIRFFKYSTEHQSSTYTKLRNSAYIRASFLFAPLFLLRIFLMRLTLCFLCRWIRIFLPPPKKKKIPNLILVKWSSKYAVLEKKYQEIQKVGKISETFSSHFYNAFKFFFFNGLQHLEGRVLYQVMLTNRKYSYYSLKQFM